MLGSASDADDAVQEAWLRLQRSDIGDVRNLRAWLTTVVARICLDVLRARGVRREDPLDDAETRIEDDGVDPEQQAVLADSVGAALMVVLQTLSPGRAARACPARHVRRPVRRDRAIVGRSPNATAQLAARARRRVRGKPPEPGTDAAAERRIVDAFLAAARAGNFDALLALLHPDVELRADAVAAGSVAAVVVRGARDVAARARMFATNAQYAEPALIDGGTGVVVAPDGRLALVLQFATDGRVIRGIDIHADPRRLDQFEFAILG